MPLYTNFDVDLASPPKPPATESTAAESTAASSYVRAGISASMAVTRTAYLVIHGMGQQVPYETLSSLGQSMIGAHMRKREEAKVAPMVPKPVVRRVSLNGVDQVSRVEMELTTPDGDPHEVHLYEAYWAPLTEGQIGMGATIGFLYQAALSGITTCAYSFFKWRPFQRYIFGKPRTLSIKPHTLSALVLFAFLISLVLIPVLLLLTPLRTILWKSFSPWLWAHLLCGPWWGQVLIVLGGIALIASTLFIRYLLVEFVGDVAIYVTSYKVSRYDAIRTAIHAQANGIAGQIYALGTTAAAPSVPPSPKYDRVVIVGHSLGSVIAYDTLNAMINLDEIVNAGAMEVVPRTTRLITFGSPLDKTAFLFRTQVAADLHLREPLAALQQPLIQDYARYRPTAHFRWINIYSRRDVVSGILKYYDVPKPGYAEKHGSTIVDNQPDPEAWIPLIAHVQYWKNRVLHDVLYDAL